MAFVVRGFIVKGRQIPQRNHKDRHGSQGGARGQDSLVNKNSVFVRFVLHGLLRSFEVPCGPLRCLVVPVKNYSFEGLLR